MEGILFDVTVSESLVAFLAGIAVLAIATTAILLGYVAEKEARGGKVYWAEWPIPEGETHEPAAETTTRLAA